ncbi:MFS transporter [Pseudomonas sp. LFM046]|uniref:MFS transporter n=1 Tax=Pseudomonas sp. LFM046 TaxID=1608357 RepID=UPI000A8F446F|nr:MFS transporter [Pseudomonas sp. LFM046]
MSRIPCCSTPSSPRRVLLACGIAPDLSYLIAARVAQGIGAAFMLPSSMALLASAYPSPTERGWAMAVWGDVSACALVAGPVVGGADRMGGLEVDLLPQPAGGRGGAAYAVAATSTRNLQEGQDPTPTHRLFWCVMLTLIPLAMLFAKVSLSTMKTAVVLTSIPFMVILLTMIYGFFRWMRRTTAPSRLTSSRKSRSALGWRRGLRRRRRRKA